MTEKSEKPAEKASTPAGGDSQDGSRRRFLEVAGIGGLGAVVGGAVAAPAVGFVTYPLTHATVSGGEDFVVVGKRSLFVPGKPVKVDIFADKVDAYNRVLQVKVGSAWVLDTGSGLAAYSTVCPHLGCAVDYDAEGDKFKCPCHRSSFGKDGSVQAGPSPRPMDALEVEEKDGKVTLRYVRFKQGISAKESV